MKLHHLKYFVTVAEERSFSRASQRLFISQPALSQQISALEAEFNVKLFIRGGKLLELSDAGKVFYRYAVKILELSDEVAREVLPYSLSQQKTRQFSITATIGDNALTHFNFYRVFDAWRTGHPELESKFRRINVYQAMRALDLNKTDLVINNLPSVDSLKDLPYERKILYSSELYLVVNRQLYNGPSLDGLLYCFHGLSQPICMILNQGDIVWNNHIRDNVLAPLGIRYTVSYEKNYMSAIDNARYSNSVLLSFDDPSMHGAFNYISTGLASSFAHTVALYKPDNDLAAEFLDSFQV